MTNSLNGCGRRSGLRMVTLGFIGLVVASLIGACGSQGQTSEGPTPTPDEKVTQVSIYELDGDPGERLLRMAVGSCHNDPTVEVVETEGEVQLTATIIGEPSVMECLDYAEVTLEDPLGDRQVRDMVTGEILEVGALQGT